ncbi:MAG TPA: penicillin-binding protein 1C [Polyangiaceae bacterium]|nr:penicillin-binding protein 1C [Polyangiaceae bacterium]
MKRSLQILRALLFACAACSVAIACAVARTPLPKQLQSAAAPETGVRYLDRHGRLIHTTRIDGGAHANWVPFEALPATTVAAVLAAEDKRFYSHPGVDPLAVLRATGQWILHRRAVSGASTLTQQLARTLEPRPRTLRGKAAEGTLALRLELTLGKNAILEQYVNRVDFGPNLRGIGAASRFYFDKPAAALSLAEAAALAGMVRGPTLYDPRRRPELALLRRDRVLRRLLRTNLVAEDLVHRALAEPLMLQPRDGEGGAHHFVRVLSSRASGSALADDAADEFRTTLDLSLQTEVEGLTRRAVDRLKEHDASAAAVVVLDNASGDVLAYVGSAGFYDQEALGQNDGVLALRQPGSTLKPFVYATAMEHLGYSAATIVPDVELHLSTAQGDYTPKNYDGRQHGPVRVREALSNSLNIPAVFTAAQVSPGRVLDTLHRAGFASLTEDAAHYGAAIALGDGEVRLLELAAAYTSLARQGRMRPPRFVLASRNASGAWREQERSPERRVMRPETAAVLFDILADDVARAGAVGRGNVLELPFAAAVKTGTSKGHRDNFTVGVSAAVTVAVWVGNFDGRPMIRSSGVTGAGPLFRDVMLAAMRDRDGELPAPGAEIVELKICEGSGQLPGPHCSHVVSEHFAAASAPTESCALHQEIWVDEDNGLLSQPGCDGAVRRVVENYEPKYRAWARKVGRPVAPDRASPRCRQAAAHARGVRILFPYDGARFVRDPGLAAAQQRVQVRLQSGVSDYELSLDGRRIASGRGAPSFALSPGSHQLRLQAGGQVHSVRFDVE